MAAENVKFQVNLKTARQGLHNIYAESADEAVASLLEFQEKVLPEILKTEELLWAGAAVAPLAVPQPAAASGVPASGSPVTAPGGSKQCAHGEMVYREGVNARGTWKGYFCPSPKGTPGQCKAEFIR